MLEELWNALIEFTTTLVVPDWGALVALIPIGLAGLVGLWLLWTVWRFATAGPTRRGVRRLEPLPPPGVHAPGPSFAPLLGALGTFLLFFGLLAGGVALWLGVIALAVTLLYWGREAMRDYEHIPDVAGHHGETALVLAAPVDRQPPPGVHLPPPSFRPLLISIGMTILVLGLVVGGWLLVVGAIAVTVTSLGWLRDARREYVERVHADVTGHLEDTGGNPPWPTGTLAVLAILVAGALVLGSGVLPIGGDPAAGPGATAAPGEPGEPGGQPGGAPGGEPSTPPLPDADVAISAENIAFLETSVQVPAGAPFTIAFDNRDAGIPHNIEIKDGGGATVFLGDIFNGVEVRVYEVPALAAGGYQFICTVHPNMTGTLTAG